MTERRISATHTDELGPERETALIALCEAGFGKPFARAWQRVGPGLHVVADSGGVAVAHALIVDRRLYLGHEADMAIDVGYVEHVATRPGFERLGHATAVMERVAAIIRDEYALGGLATRDNGFYERLGWETWRGPTGLRMPDGERVRTDEQDGEVMVLRTQRSPADLSLDAPIFVDWRPEDPW
jgi:aminoglycoside 2'-N-acetyltransferase I